MAVERRPRRGVDYPRSAGEFRAWFSTDEACLDYLEWLRWPDGFLCPACGFAGGWRVGDGRWKCAGCEKRTAVTAGALFDRRRTPLTVWFEACWQFATAKDGVSALSLQRSLEIGSYATAWSMLHRLRRVLHRPGREQLTGTVEVDETYIGGHEEGLSGGRARGKKALVAVAVESSATAGYGRSRMEIIPDASGPTLEAFVADAVTPGAHVVTDGWNGYKGLAERGYTHEPRNQTAARKAGVDPATLLPGVHRVASLAKRWLLSTHQGSAGSEHLQKYLDEFTFRFNRRKSRSRGLLFYRILELAVGHPPVRYRDLVVNPSSKKTPPSPPGARGHPPQPGQTKCRSALETITEQSGQMNTPKRGFEVPVGPLHEPLGLRVTGAALDDLDSEHAADPVHRLRERGPPPRHCPSAASPAPAAHAPNQRGVSNARPADPATDARAAWSP